MLNRIEELKPQLRKSERKVANYVLTRPNTAIQTSLAVLARNAGVSEPTVVRFCRAVGCNGFQDFKLRLAQSLASSGRYFHYDVLSEHLANDVTAKVFDLTIKTLIRIRNHLDEKTLQTAVGMLTNATRIEFYGMGASATVAADAQRKFIFWGLPAVVHADSHIQRLAAALLKPGNVAVAISDQGNETELLRAAELARKAGADVICITASASPLAQLGSVTLFVDVIEDIYKLNTARIAHLVTIDALAMAVALRRSPELLNQLQTIEQKIEEPPNEDSS